MRARSTLEFLGLWEKLHNANFKGVEFDPLLYEAGSNSFVMSPSRWIALTDARGIRLKKGRGGGTFAHKDIAFEFGTWLSPAFKLYLIKEFERLKQLESQADKQQWNLHRALSKINYRIHTDAIKAHIVPKALSKKQITQIYAEEADVLNLALFGQTAKDWRSANPEAEGNMRDEATIEQLLVLANLESLNAELVRMGMPQPERIQHLNQAAISQIQSLLENPSLKKWAANNTLKP